MPGEAERINPLSPELEKVPNLKFMMAYRVSSNEWKHKFQEALQLKILTVMDTASLDQPPNYDAPFRAN